MLEFLELTLYVLTLLTAGALTLVVRKLQTMNDTKDTRIGHLKDEQIALKQEQIAEREGRIAALEAKLSRKPSRPMPTLKRRVNPQTDQISSVAKGN